MCCSRPSNAGFLPQSHDAGAAASRDRVRTYVGPRTAPEQAHRGAHTSSAPIVLPATPLTESVGTIQRSERVAALLASASRADTPTTAQVSARSYRETGRAVRRVSDALPGALGSERCRARCSPAIFGTHPQLASARRADTPTTAQVSARSYRETGRAVRRVSDALPGALGSERCRARPPSSAMKGSLKSAGRSWRLRGVVGATRRPWSCLRRFRALRYRTGVFRGLLGIIESPEEHVTLSKQ
jgi:hypothetical protein